MTTLLSRVAPLLARSPSHELVRDVLACVSSALEATTEVWLVDYNQGLLHGLLSGEQAPVDDSLVGRCFASQSVLVGSDAIAVPLSARGNRQGVLEVSGGDEHRDELLSISALLTQALLSLGTQTGVYERKRRRAPMTVAAEIQWALLPGQAYSDDDVTLGAMLEPAYSIAGDAYDFTRDCDVLHLAVLDGTGRGVPAAMATTLALGALRNARFAESSLPDQAALADQAVYAHYAGESFTSALLFQFHIPSGRAWVVDAGSPLLYRAREGKLEPIELEAQLPLGMFEETLYQQQELDLVPGDRLFIVSDGVHGLRTRDGSDFGSALLEQVLRDSRLLTPAEVTRHVMRRLRAEQSDDGPDDDAVVVCLDWHPQRT